MSTSPLCFDPFVVNNVLGDRFLDVACGSGKWGFLLKTYRIPQTGSHVYVAGVDLRESSVAALKGGAVYDEVHLADACKLPFADKSFDSVVACEILEHLTPEKGSVLMSELRRVARQCVVVSTPNNAGLRKGFDALEDHQSSYNTATFKALGFTQIIGLGMMRLPSWKLGNVCASWGLMFPSRSSYLMGFWFADGKKRVLCAD